ncbi:hypothetical protein DM01DRAFT_1337331 [Hesseltinella vesiculosa]|uniref:Uncharacterized protein n=1 Tax=Hesseltinella vesiculosa TaxID=101127 RepID=A0A1X2GDM9_9FUNG|nr:hypothetical protein DM01DRAFT_1337331 [Hesseltinella vesiculosa]
MDAPFIELPPLQQAIATASYHPREESKTPPVRHFELEPSDLDVRLSPSPSYPALQNQYTNIIDLRDVMACQRAYRCSPSDNYILSLVEIANKHGFTKSTFDDLKSIYPHASDDDLPVSFHRAFKKLGHLYPSPFIKSYCPSCLTPYEPTETSRCVNPQCGTSTAVTNSSNNPLLIVEYQLPSRHLAALLANDSTRSLLQKIHPSTNQGVAFADDSTDVAISLFIDDFNASKKVYRADKMTMVLMIIFAFDPALRHHLEHMVPVAVLPFASNGKQSRLMLSMLLAPLLTTSYNLNMTCVS